LVAQLLTGAIPPTVPHQAKKRGLEGIVARDETSIYIEERIEEMAQMQGASNSLSGMDRGQDAEAAGIPGSARRQEAHRMSDATMIAAAIYGTSDASFFLGGEEDASLRIGFSGDRDCGSYFRLWRNSPSLGRNSQDLVLPVPDCVCH
jgi:hypothetical protein